MARTIFSQSPFGFPRGGTSSMPGQPFGLTRKKTGFLFLPKVINNEMRWLELASWIEVYAHYTREDRWVPIGWADDEDEGGGQ